MSLSEKLAELRRRRDEEVRVLDRTYLRTKRDVQRMVSPARFVRRHIGVSLAAAAALGMVLAPRSASREAKHHESNGDGRRVRGGFALGWAKKIIAHLFPEAAPFLPDDPEMPGEESAPPKKEKRGLVFRLLELFGPMLLSKINWRELFNEVTHSIYEDMQGHSAEGEPKGSDVSINDGETISSHDYENFDGAEKST